MPIPDEADGSDNLTTPMAEVGRKSVSSDHTLNFLQVVAGAFGGAIALVGVVIAYLAWTDPHSVSQGSQSRPRATAPPVASTTTRSTTLAGHGASAAVPGSIRYLADVPPDAGSAYLVTTKNAKNLTIHCASGQSGDQSHTVEYSLFGVYATLRAGAGISGPVRPESVAQLDVNADGQEVKRVDLTLGAPSVEIDSSLDDAQSMSITVVCQDPAGIITLSKPTLYR